MVSSAPQIAFSPDGQYLFLTVGERQRMTPAQDPDQALGKILRLTLDGKPAPGNPMAGKTGAASVPLIDPPSDTEAAKTARVVSTYTFPAPNLAPAETWATGVRTPYGLAFAPDGRLWEVEHGPMGGDELNLIEPGKNYGWPLVSYGDELQRRADPDPTRGRIWPSRSSIGCRSSRRAISCSTTARCSRSGTAQRSSAAWQPRRSPASRSTARAAPRPPSAGTSAGASATWKSRPTARCG